MGQGGSTDAVDPRVALPPPTGAPTEAFPPPPARSAPYVAPATAPPPGPNAAAANAPLEFDSSSSTGTTTTTTSGTTGSSGATSESTVQFRLSPTTTPPSELASQTREQHDHVATMAPASVTVVTGGSASLPVAPVAVLPAASNSLVPAAPPAVTAEPSTIVVAAPAQPVQEQPSASAGELTTPQPSDGSFSTASRATIKLPPRTEMRAWQCDAPSEHLDTIRLVTLPLPVSGPGEVRIRVVAAGVNPVDWKRTMFEAGITFVFPYLMGCDGCGIVDSVGPPHPDTAQATTAWSVGDRVYFHNSIKRRDHGTFAEFTLASAAAICPIPNEVSWADAAAVPCAAWTAYVALFEKLRVVRGGSIVIVGASGGVGLFAVDMCRAMGVRVFTISGTSNLEVLVKGKRVDLAMDYRRESRSEMTAKVLGATLGVGVDYVLDLVGAAGSSDTVKNQKGSTGPTAAAESALLMYAEMLRFSGAYCTIVGGGGKGGTDSSCVIGNSMVQAVFFGKQLSIHYCCLGALYDRPHTVGTLRFLGDHSMVVLLQGRLQQNVGTVPPTAGGTEAVATPVKPTIPAQTEENGLSAFNVSEIIRFEQIPSALTIIRQGHVKGKVVMSFVHPTIAKRPSGAAMVKEPAAVSAAPK